MLSIRIQLSLPLPQMSNSLPASKKKDVLSINYKGPSAIHSSLHSETQKRGFKCMSFWCHCPYYLQGTTHLGLLSHLGSLLSSLVSFDMDTEELEIIWRDLSKQIQGIKMFLSLYPFHGVRSKQVFKAIGGSP